MSTQPASQWSSLVVGDHDVTTLAPQPPGSLVLQTPGPNPIEWVRMQADGKCFVRGELVEENAAIWAEVKAWLLEGLAFRVMGT